MGDFRSAGAGWRAGCDRLCQFGPDGSSLGGCDWQGATGAQVAQRRCDLRSLVARVASYERNTPTRLQTLGDLRSVGTDWGSGSDRLWQLWRFDSNLGAFDGQAATGA